MLREYKRDPRFENEHCAPYLSDWDSDGDSDGKDDGYENKHGDGKIDNAI